VRFRQSYNANPGPGEYNISRKFQGQAKAAPSAVFTSQVERSIFLDKAVDQDGLTHRPWEVKPESRAPFGRRQRGRHLWDINKNPSPADYNVRKERSVKKSIAPFGHRTGRPIFVPNENPGPSDYDIGTPRRVKDDSDQPFGQRSVRFGRDPQNNEFTGPGQYEHNVQEDLHRQKLKDRPSPPFRVTTERDPFKVDIESPGPGEYETERNSAALNQYKLRKCMDGSDRNQKGMVFGERLRDTPGPGKYYVLPNQRGKAYIPHSPRYSFAGKQGPGPDLYRTEGSMVKPSLNVTYSCFKL
jgi:hypothetical protein